MWAEKVHLSNHMSGISKLFQVLRHGHLFQAQTEWLARKDDRVLQAQLHRMTAGEQRCSRRGADHRCVVVVQDHTVLCQPVYVWCRNLKSAMKAGIGVALQREVSR